MVASHFPRSIEGMFARAEEMEREALYAVVGRLLDGWVAMPVMQNATHWNRHNDFEPLFERDEMTAAEATIVRVARLMSEAAPSSASRSTDESQ